VAMYLARLSDAPFEQIMQPIRCRHGDVSSRFDANKMDLVENLKGI
jgi:hypothetical protein